MAPSPVGPGPGRSGREEIWSIPAPAALRGRAQPVGGRDTIIEGAPLTLCKLSLTAYLCYAMGSVLGSRHFMALPPRASVRPKTSLEVAGEETLTGALVGHPARAQSWLGGDCSGGNVGRRHRADGAALRRLCLYHRG